MTFWYWLAVVVQAWFFGTVQLFQQLWEHECARYEANDVDPGAL